MSADVTKRNNQWVSGWLPPLQQVLDALQFRLDAVIGATREQQTALPDEPATNTALATSMRQGLGLVVLLALLAGLLPFGVHWVNAGRVGTALPLVQLAQSMELRAQRMTRAPLPMQVWVETAKTLAGLEPRVPGWLAAGLSSLGAWLNQPLSWLTFWLVYGLGILIVGKLLGATTTLQHFYAATSYAYAPLVLTTLRPIPWLGPLATFVAMIWTLILYVRIVQLVTGLSTGRSVLSVLLPGAVASLLALMAVGAFVISLMRMVL